MLLLQEDPSWWRLADRNGEIETLSPPAPAIDAVPPVRANAQGTTQLAI